MNTAAAEWAAVVAARNAVETAKAMGEKSPAENAENAEPRGDLCHED